MVSETECAEEVQVDELDTNIYNIFMKQYLMNKTTYEVRIKRFWIQGHIVPDNEQKNS